MTTNAFRTKIENGPAGLWLMIKGGSWGFSLPDEP